MVAGTGKYESNNNHFPANYAAKLFAESLNSKPETLAKSREASALSDGANWKEVGLSSVVASFREEMPHDLSTSRSVEGSKRLITVHVKLSGKFLWNANPKYLYGTKYGFCSSNFPYGLGKYSLYWYLGPFGHGTQIHVHKGWRPG